MMSATWPLDISPEFRRVWELVSPFTMTSPERGYALWSAVNHVVDNDIPGVFVECGVWKGGSAMLMALALLERRVSRDIFLFDTFEGMTEPSDADRDLNGVAARELMEGGYGERISELVVARAGLEEVKRALASTGYDPRLLHYVRGDVRETLPRTQTLSIALLRLDTDFYDSTLAELEHLYPRVNAGAPVIIDDFGHWQGACKAVETYFSDPARRGRRPLLWAVDYTGRAFVKTEPATNVEVERYDYVPPDMEDPGLQHLFPAAEPVNPWAINWPHLRPSAPHVFRSDRRNTSSIPTGNASYEEATCLYNVAKQFRGRRGLEIGTHFAWTAAHLRAAGLELDLIDPAFAEPERDRLVRETLDAVQSPASYHLWPLFSPAAVEVARARANEPWSFAFIDGNHDGDAPEDDARAVLEHCAADAAVMFHDMTSPHVARGLAVFQDAGWNVAVWNTMQVMGVAWRGEVVVPRHVADPNVPRLFYSHLERFLRP